MNTAVKKTFSAAMIAMVGWIAFAANVKPAEFANAQLRGESDKDVYKAGETVTFTLHLEGAGEIPQGDFFIDYHLFDDDGKDARGRAPLPLPGGQLTLMTSIAQPGFVRLDAWVVDKDGRRMKGVNPWNKEQELELFFYGGAAVEPEKLAITIPEPADFDAYWSRQKKRLANVPPKVLFMEEKPSVNKDVKIYAVGIAAPGRAIQPASAQVKDVQRVTGFLVVPADGRKVPGRVMFEGYGVHESRCPSWWIAPDAVYFFVNAHGSGLDKDKAFYDSWRESLNTKSADGKTTYTYGMNPVENANPDTAYFNGMVMRVLRALEYVKSRPEWDGRTLIVSGGSQGGLQTTWAGALDHDVTEVNLDIPWCCDIGCTTVNGVIPTWRLEWAKGLGYYDECSFAKRFPKTCKVTIHRAALGDELCPPKGVAAFYNAIETQKKITWAQGSNHGYAPPPPRQEFTFQANNWK